MDRILDQAVVAIQLCSQVHTTTARLEGGLAMVVEVPRDVLQVQLLPGILAGTALPLVETHMDTQASHRRLGLEEERAATVVYLTA
jgi:hypothetical protein